MVMMVAGLSVVKTEAADLEAAMETAMEGV